MLGKRLIQYDIRNGFKSNYVKIIIFMLIICIINLIGANEIHNCEKMYSVDATLMDYICHIVGGPAYIPEDMFELYSIPVLLMIQNAMIAYIVGYYAATDLERYGIQVLTRCGSRKKWWFSKCVWNGITVIVLYVCIYVITAVIAIVCGGNLSYRLTPEIVTNACSINCLNGDSWEYIICLILMPVIVSLTLSMLQMTISLISSPVIGFLIIESILLLSTMFTDSLLFPNYGMLSHNRITCGSDIVMADGIIICGLIYIASMVGGLIYFSKTDIVGKNKI